MTEAQFDEDDIEEQTDDRTGDLSFDTPDGSVASIVTAGDPMRSWLGALTVLVDEAKFRIDETGLSVSAVDPANVGMVSIDWDEAGFTDFRFHADEDELVVGMPLSGFASGGDLKTALGYARKRSGNGDPVRIDVIQDGGRTRIQVAVIRPDQQAKRVTEFFAIDPDSVRQEPDIPDLSKKLPNRSQPGVDALADALAETIHDHVFLERDDATLVIGNQPTENPNLDSDDDVVDTFEFPNAAWEKDDEDIEDGVGMGGSVFSIDYLKDFVEGLGKSKADRMTLDFGEEYPARIDWDATDWGISGQYMLAPRIMRDDEPGGI